jgi:hypothetical protein
MSLTQLSNLQTELAIIEESIEMFQSIEFYPSTYSDLINRRNEILGV